jgi:hypothetical protein
VAFEVASLADVEVVAPQEVKRAVRLVGGCTAVRMVAKRAAQRVVGMVGVVGGRVAQRVAGWGVGLAVATVVVTALVAD